MPGTLSINGSISYINGSDSVQKPFGQTSIVVTGTLRQSGVVSVGTSQEALPLGEVTSVGFVSIKNLDATNFVTIGTTTGQLGIKLKAGESCIFRASANNVYALANTAACFVSYDIFSD